MLLAPFISVLAMTTKSLATSCRPPFQLGNCESVSSCAGFSLSGYCPGGEDIQCCITEPTQLSSPEQKVIQWIKKYTVPNTLTGEGNPWTKEALPSAVQNVFDSKIKPAAYAAAIVTGWSLYEGVFDVGDFYRLEDRCKCFNLPAQLPPKSDFPTEVFSYNFCQGDAVNVSSTSGEQERCPCSCSGNCAGQFIGPNQKCIGRNPAESDWQNGMWGMEQSHVAGAFDLATRAENIYQKLRGPQYSYVNVLRDTLSTAGFPPGSEVSDNVMRCFPGEYVQAKDLSMPCADLVSMWLVRNHLVGLTVAIDDNLGWLPQNLNMVKVLASYFNS